MNDINHIISLGYLWVILSVDVWQLQMRKLQNPQKTYFHPNLHQEELIS